MDSPRVRRKTRREALETPPEPWPIAGDAAASPWLQWEDEPSLAYAHFTAYREVEPAKREIRAAYQVWQGQAPEPVAPAPKAWYDLARQWRWEDRARRYDQWRERAMMEGTRTAWKEMGERHAREAMALQQKALERLQALNPMELTAAEVRQFIVAAANLERMARGASLADLAEAQRSRDEEAAEQGVAVIRYVDDWRGDARRRSQRNEDSYYGNGQGRLPSPREEGPSAGFNERVGDDNAEEALQRAEAELRQSSSGLPIPTAAPGAGPGPEAAEALHLAERGPEVAQDHPGHDARR